MFDLDVGLVLAVFGGGAVVVVVDFGLWVAMG